MVQLRFLSALFEFCGTLTGKFSLEMCGEMCGKSSRGNCFAHWFIRRRGCHCGDRGKAMPQIHELTLCRVSVKS